ncbi:hypothetical protein O3M35_010283 [Rhynocoris fuscipes]|uniref:EF-hand domain-containing protein n=1 Tax=Rhynocoris fuscipes TaxID=488301 RepID=A0AAW1D1I2_9HEMI
MFLTRVLMAAFRKQGKQTPAERIREYFKRDGRLKPRLHKPPQLYQNEIEYHEKLFRQFDKNKDSYLNKNELRELVKHVTNETLVDNFNTDKPFNKMDINGDRKVSLQEYLAHVSNSKKKMLPDKKLIEIFNSYDTNFDAHINLDELRQILLYMGEDYGRSDLRNIFVSVDEDKDGFIDVYQFLNLMNNKLRAK